MFCLLSFVVDRVCCAAPYMEAWLLTQPVNNGELSVIIIIIIIISTLINDN